MKNINLLSPKVFASVALCAFFVAGAVAPANALEAESTPADVSQVVDSVEVQAGAEAASASGIITDPVCLAEVSAVAIERGLDEGEVATMCDSLVEIEVSAVEQVSPAEAERIAASGELDAADTQSFSQAARASAIYSASWTAVGTGGAYTFKEVMKGKTFFDGNKAWVAKHRGKTGWFRCHEAGSYAIGVVMSPISCTKWRTAANGVGHRSKVDISVAIAGGPISFTHHLDAVVTKNGKVSTSHN